MRRNRRRFTSEINLTPLLDVLFSILFIVMMTGSQNEKTMKDEYQQKVNELEQQNVDLAEQLDQTTSQLASYDQFEQEAIILTVTNVNRNENHHLILYSGTDRTEFARIQMGIDKTINTKNRIESIITQLIQSSDHEPIYIVFHCDKKQIYTAEYRAVVETFEELQRLKKQVFFKVAEVN